jgi:hypothetical protein
VNGSMVVSLVALTASLFLATRALRAQNLSFETMAGMAAAWFLIIAVVAFVAERFFV